MFYSPSKNGFFTPEFRADYEAAGTWPDDAIAIEPAHYAALMQAQNSGARITSDDSGAPIAVFPPPPTLDELKAAKNAQINQWRMDANYKTFDHAGKTFSCDVLSRSDIDGVANHIALTGAFPAGFPGVWKATDNTYLPMPDIDAFGNFYRSMAAQGAANFGHTQQLKERLAQATTAAEIDAITWSN